MPAVSPDPQVSVASERAVLVKMHGVSKTYGSIRALKNVSFTLHEGEVHALLGHNGAGKSTLVSVLSGVVSPDEGEIAVSGEVTDLRSPRDAQLAGIALVAQELSVVPTLSVQENILLGRVGATGKAASRDEVRELLTRLGMADVGPDTLVEDLSMGERQLIEIARALSRNARVLILDEPTASLADREIQRVFAAVRQIVAEGRSVVFVSHRLGEVLELCSRVTVMRDGEVTATREVAGLDRRGIVQLMLGDVAEPEPHRTPSEQDAEEDVLVIDSLTVPGRVSGFQLTAKRGQIIGIAGQVGSGASEVARALAGLMPDARGRVLVGGRAMRLGAPGRALRAGVVFASNDRKSEGLFLSQTIGVNLVATRMKEVARVGVLRAASIQAAAGSIADLLKLDRARLSHTVGVLSGGNQQKVFIGRCLDRDDSAVLILDEPTRGVDVGGRADIHALVRHAAQAGTTVLFVSSDHEEVLELADVVLTMFAGKVAKSYRSGEVTAAALLADMTHGGTQEAA